MKVDCGFEVEGFFFKGWKELEWLPQCQIVESIEKREILDNSTPFNKLVEKFGDEVSDKRAYGTLGTPRFKVTRPDEGSNTIDENLQKHYHWGVSMLLY